MPAFEEAGRSGGNSGGANLVNPTTMDQAKVILNVSTRDIVGQINLSWGGGDSHMYCRMAKSILGLYPLGALLPPFCPSCSNPEYLKTLPDVLWGTKPPPLEKYYSRPCSSRWVSSTPLGYQLRILPAIPFCGPTFWVSGRCFDALLSWLGRVSFHIASLVFTVGKYQTATVALSQFLILPS